MDLERKKGLKGKPREIRFHPDQGLWVHKTNLLECLRASVSRIIQNQPWTLVELSSDRGKQSNNRLRLSRWVSSQPKDIGMIRSRLPGKDTDQILTNIDSPLLELDTAEHALQGSCPCWTHAVKIKG